MAAPPLVVVGAGGHAKVVITTARALGWTVDRVVDDNAARWGQALLGVPIVGGSAIALDDPDAIAIVAIGDNAVRDRLARAARCQFATLVHPRALVDASVALGDGTVVFAGCVIQPDARLGRHVIVNTAASIDHDCVLGDAVHIAPGVRLAGAVVLGDGAFMGIGSSAIPEARIGAWTTVGAGAAVVGVLPPHITAVGVPARPLDPADGKQRLA